MILSAFVPQVGIPLCEALLAFGNEEYEKVFYIK